MSDIVISVKNLSKSYLIGHRSGRQEGYATLRDVIAREASNFYRKAVGVARGRQIVQGDEVEEFWALHDISFEVRRGEVLGIVGRNGAGKSTLLKILSRITDPTGGRVTISGRVASLLEVGTGFHPELTGRENIYLNGAILGMKRREITETFNDIVAFAEVERFLDTPVKRYSSGMYVRLAFAVAAHLNPEILIIDEVLAVGDAEFQNRCLGKMREVASSGRTVLFVSHNLAAVKALCQRALEIRDGKLVGSGEPADVIGKYLRAADNQVSRRSWSFDVAPGSEHIKLCGIQVHPQHGSVGDPITSDKGIQIEIEFVAHVVEDDLCVGFQLLGGDGSSILWTYQTDMPLQQWPSIRTGRNVLRCTIPAGLLNGGSYSIAPKLSRHNRYWYLDGGPEISFDVVLNHGVSPFWKGLSNGKRPGIITPILNWESVQG